MQITDVQLNLIIEAVTVALEEAGVDLSFMGTFNEEGVQQDLRRKILFVLKGVLQ